jgi:hypothetical protein
MPQRLFDGKGLPGEGCLGDEQVLRLQNASITGDDIPSVQDHHVPWHDLIDRDLDGLSVPQDHGLDLNEGEQLVHGVGRSPFLPESEQAADQDDREDQQGVSGLAEEKRQRHCEEQDQDYGTLELCQQQGQGTTSPHGLA